MISVLVSPADAELANHLQRRRARVITWPAVEPTEAEDLSSLNQAIEDLFGYDWLVLKNERAAEYFLQQFELLHQPEELDELRVLTIGEHTTERLIDKHIHVDVALDRFSFDTTFTAIESYLGSREAIAGLNFLVPCANITSDVFAAQIADAGARVDSVTAYRTTPDRIRLGQINALLIGGGINCVAFTTTSALEQFTQLFDSDNLPCLLNGIPAACLDDDTTAAAKAFGLSVITSKEPSIAKFAALILGVSA
jgi:uroporphyrinogen-III synthase